MQFRSYAFIAPRVIIAVSDADSGSLDVYRIEGPYSPHQDENRWTEDRIIGLRPLARLQLPRSNFGWRYRDLGLAASQFTPHLPPRLLLVTLACANGVKFAAYRLVVWLPGIVDHTSRQMGRPRTIPWEEWGPNNSRLFNETPCPDDDPLEHWCVLPLYLLQSLMMSDS